MGSTVNEGTHQFTRAQNRQHTRPTPLGHSAVHTGARSWIDGQHSILEGPIPRARRRSTQDESSRAASRVGLQLGCE